MKSWSVARALVILSIRKTLRILCAREQQNSIAESVHKLLSDQIAAMGLSQGFEIQRDKIICKVTGSTFFFEGIKANVDRIKSYEGVDICWVEEAHKVSETSWGILVPTIRKEGSEIWITFNPDLESDYTYKHFVVERANDPDSWICFISWRENRWVSDRFRKEAEKLREEDYIKYLNVYEGHCRILADGAVYGTEIAKMMGQQRITKVPYQSHIPVDTIWDLGWADSTCVWFRQRIGFEFHYIDFYQNSQKPLAHYFKVLQDRGYVYGTAWLPHDARAKEKGSGLSIEEQFRKAHQTRIVKRLSISDGIDAARSHFALAWIDKAKCAEGIKALGQYRYEVLEEATGALSRVPVHDWSSHAADGWRYSAISSTATRSPTAEALAERMESITGAKARKAKLAAALGSEWGLGGTDFNTGTGWMR